MTKPETHTKPATSRDVLIAEVPTVPHDEVWLFVRARPICLLHVDKSPPTDASVLEAFARHPHAIVGRIDPTTSESTAVVNAWLHARDVAVID